MLFSSIRFLSRSLSLSLPSHRSILQHPRSRLCPFDDFYHFFFELLFFFLWSSETRNKHGQSVQESSVVRWLRKTSWCIVGELRRIRAKIFSFEDRAIPIASISNFNRQNPDDDLLRTKRMNPNRVILHIRYMPILFPRQALTKFFPQIAIRSEPSIIQSKFQITCYLSRPLNRLWFRDHWQWLRKSKIHRALQWSRRQIETLKSNWKHGMKLFSFPLSLFGSSFFRFWCLQRRKMWCHIEEQKTIREQNASVCVYFS